jgi:hypothetical protein
MRNLMIGYRKGAENIPLRTVINSCPALVVVYDLANGDNPIVENRIEYSNPEDRKWLGRITAWALTHHCSVETMALVDAEVEVVKEGNDK